MAEYEGGNRPWWQWLIIVLVIFAIIYGLVRLFAAAVSRPPGGALPTPTSFLEATPTVEPTTELTPTPTPTGRLSPTPSRRPTGTITPTRIPTLSQTPETGI